MSLHIEIDGGRSAFEPGEELSGTARWQLDKAPRAVELRLFWFTRGGGTEDTGVVETVNFDHPSADEKRSFRLRLPPGPYSFTGQLITLTWALELVATPFKDVARQQLVIAPGGEAVQLMGEPEPTIAVKVAFRRKRQAQGQP